ncbi:acyltransferase [Hymenobacter canadensis]|uniref:Acyltransferase n=1 Tax=Hymenobacter canadensis TaxID=2999067 RepID=A0ABY7LRM9_9BACT|nr:acyltransferase [Hymenobacter canadensis]WBA43078.1 acyltransferase [Hymenobacter canadensis]
MSLASTPDSAAEAAPAARSSGLAARIKSSPQLKKLAAWLLFQPRRSRPRFWVKWLANPFVHKYAPGSLVRRARRDLVPFHAFELGRDSILEDYVTVANGMGGIHIGDRTLIGIGDVLIGPVRIGHHVILAQHVVLSGLNHGYQDPSRPIRDQPCTAAEIVVEDEVWIGANAVVTAGVRIGRHAVVAGGSVVTKDVPPYSVVAGNPARVLRQLNPATGQWERV